MSLVLLISCSSTKTNIKTCILISQLEISDPDASFLLKQYPINDNFFNADTIFVFPGTEIFSLDSIAKKVIEKSTPFSPSTEFGFILTYSDSVKISINASDSSFMKDVFVGYLNKGYYGLILKENKIESGIYWINYSVGKKERHRKFVLMR